ncbi:transposase [Mycoplasmopsis agassizii]|uniref:transposase n=1 Tax=Mycoplasmopsis agassizii TaxID=33922 RepID=UPI0035277F24
MNRDFKSEAPNQKWTTDVTEFKLPFGKVYLSPILDMFNNEIISFNISLSPNFNQITKMLNGAFKKFSTLENLIFHSDQGWQYRNERYVKNWRKKNYTVHVKKGKLPWQRNYGIFFGVLKNEMFYGYESSIKTYKQFKKN